MHQWPQGLSQARISGYRQAAHLPNAKEYAVARQGEAGLHWRPSGPLPNQGQNIAALYLRQNREEGHPPQRQVLALPLHQKMPHLPTGSNTTLSPYLMTEKRLVKDSVSPAREECIGYRKKYLPQFASQAYADNPRLTR